MERAVCVQQNAQQRSAGGVAAAMVVLAGENPDQHSIDLHIVYSSLYTYSEYVELKRVCHGTLLECLTPSALELNFCDAGALSTPPLPILLPWPHNDMLMIQSLLLCCLGQARTQ